MMIPIMNILSPPLSYPYGPDQPRRDLAISTAILISSIISPPLMILPVIHFFFLRLKSDATVTAVPAIRTPCRKAVPAFAAVRAAKAPTTPLPPLLSVSYNASLHIPPLLFTHSPLSFCEYYDNISGCKKSILKDLKIVLDF